MNVPGTIPREMRAAVYRGVDDIRLETLPTPKIRKDELLVKVAVCGICPTDIKKIKYGTVPPPRVFGHETAGIIVATGNAVKGWRVGDKVGLHHHVPCLECHSCRHAAFAQCPQYKRTGITAGFTPAGGGFAEYVRVMNFVLPGVVRIPARNTLVEGAMLEPVNTVLKAVRLLKLLQGDVVLVAGQGPIGLMFTALLALEGMKVVATDFFEPRLRMAKQFGAAAVFHPESPALTRTVLRLTNRRGLDAAVIAVPSDQAVLQGQELLRGGGKTLLFAHTKRGAVTPIDLSSVCVDEKDFIGSYSVDFTLQQETARLVFSRGLDVRRLITHVFELENAKEAINLAAHPQPGSLKIVISMEKTLQNPRSPS